MFKIFDQPDITSDGFLSYLDSLVAAKNVLQSALSSKAQQSQEALDKLQTTAARRKDIRASVLGQSKPVTAAAPVERPKELRAVAIVEKNPVGGFDTRKPDGTVVATGAKSPQAAAAPYVAKPVKRVDSSVLDKMYTASRTLQDWCQIYGTPGVIERSASIRDYVAKMFVTEGAVVPKLVSAAQRFGSDKSVVRRAVSELKTSIESIQASQKDVSQETFRNANRLMDAVDSVEFAINKL